MVLTALAVFQASAVTGDYLIDVWSSEDGLRSSSVTAIAQTPDGYLWAGTYNGLARFDGVRFVRFDPEAIFQAGETGTATPGSPSIPSSKLQPRINS